MMEFRHFATAQLNFYDSLIPYKEEMVNHYFKGIEQTKGFSVYYSNSVLREDIGPKILQIVKDSFTVDLYDEDVPFHIYVQDNIRYNSIFHIHMSGQPNIIDPSIVGCIYLDPPKEGGEFQMMVTPGEPNSTIVTAVENNTVYLFPSWLHHRPLPQKDTKERISLCFSIRTWNRPILKSQNIFW